MVATVGKGGNARRRLLWPLLTCILAFTLFALCPLPPIVGRMTLLSFSGEDEMILPIGVGGILLSILALREMDTDARHPMRRAILLIVCGGIATNLLIAASGDSPAFFTAWRLAVTIALSWCIFALYLWPMKRLFSALLLIALFPPYIMWAPNAIWKAFDLFVGAIQAFIFSILTILYFSQAMEIEDHHD